VPPSQQAWSGSRWPQWGQAGYTLVDTTQQMATMLCSVDINHLWGDGGGCSAGEHVRRGRGRILVAVGKPRRCAPGSGPFSSSGVLRGSGPAGSAYALGQLQSGPMWSLWSGPRRCIVPCPAQAARSNACNRLNALVGLSGNLPERGNVISTCASWQAIAHDSALASSLALDS